MEFRTFLKFIQIESLIRFFLYFYCVNRSIRKNHEQRRCMNNIKLLDRYLTMFWLIYHKIGQNFYQSCHSRSNLIYICC